MAPGPANPAKGHSVGATRSASDDNLHCLQSLEEPNAAQIEGYGQFFASKVWNQDVQNDCTFVYYKNFANTSCMRGVADCTLDSASGLFVNKPPIPVSCKAASRWRNQHCLDTGSSADALTFGTESPAVLARSDKPWCAPA